jgi:phosphate uptake regulator
MAATGRKRYTEQIPKLSDLKRSMDIHDPTSGHISSGRTSSHLFVIIVIEIGANNVL